MVSYHLTVFILLVLACTCSNSLSFEVPKCVITSYCEKDFATVKLVSLKPFRGLIGMDVEKAECKRRFSFDKKSISFNVNFKKCTSGSKEFTLYVYNPLMLTKDFGFRGPALMSKNITCKKTDNYKL